MVKTQGGKLEVDDSGSGERETALVFLHYWGGSSATWRKVVALLEPEVRCVAINQRGWGGSVAIDGRYDLDALADDVVEVITHLGITRAILVGHSMGGKVAQIVAKRRVPQLAGLILVAPAPPTPMPVPGQVRAQMLASYQSAAGVEQALAMLAGPSLPAEDRPMVVSDTVAGAPDAKREWTDRGMVADLHVTPGDLAVPITLLVGSIDRVEAPDRLRMIFGELAPHARIEELTGIGHLAPLEAPVPIANACRELLAALV